ncbi:lipid droplet-associated protein [Nocardia jejuensis]|uniref:lipid droplet-associated protein n=1 Tax=Nocardia jejuensis TaxID=328049 RepID=UPI00082BB8C9|nr:lipid droplet-associated protein [Nocardia jejuensis]
MFRPPFLARVAAGAAVYALEETRRLPANAINFPITAISQMLQTTMHFQQFVTSLALKGDAVFDRLIQPEEQPEWATFDEDEADEQPSGTAPESVRKSRFDLFTAEETALDEPAPLTEAPAAIFQAPVAEAPAVAEAVVTEAPAAEAVPDEETPVVAEPVEAPAAIFEAPVVAEPAAQEAAEPVAVAENDTAATASVAATNGHNGHNGHVAVTEPEIATRYDYENMTLAQLRARLRMLTVDDLATLLAYEQGTRDRAPFVTMLTNRIATVRAK